MYYKRCGTLSVSIAMGDQDWSLTRVLNWFCNKDSFLVDHICRGNVRILIVHPFPFPLYSIHGDYCGFNTFRNIVSSFCGNIQFVFCVAEFLHPLHEGHPQPNLYLCRHSPLYHQQGHTTALSEMSLRQMYCCWHVQAR